MMRLREGDRRVISKFAEVNTKREFKFIGVIELNGTSHTITTIATYRGEAVRIFEKEAKKINGEVNWKSVRKLY